MLSPTEDAREGAVCAKHEAGELHALLIAAAASPHAYAYTYAYHDTGMSRRCSSAFYAAAEGHASCKTAALLLAPPAAVDGMCNMQLQATTEPGGYCNRSVHTAKSVTIEGYRLPPTARARGRHAIRPHCRRREATAAAANRL